MAAWFVTPSQSAALDRIERLIAGQPRSGSVHRSSWDKFRATGFMNVGTLMEIHGMRGVGKPVLTVF